MGPWGLEQCPIIWTVNNDRISTCGGTSSSQSLSTCVTVTETSDATAVSSIADEEEEGGRLHAINDTQGLACTDPEIVTVRF